VNDVRLSRRALLTGALATAAAVTLPGPKYASGGFISVADHANACREAVIPYYLMPLPHDWGGPCKWYLNQSQWDFFKHLGYDMTRDDLVLVEPIPEC
jgi:hypothetical protein